jgi:hypothetical protein
MTVALRMRFICGGLLCSLWTKNGEILQVDALVGHNGTVRATS